MKGRKLGYLLLLVLLLGQPVNAIAPVDRRAILQDTVFSEPGDSFSCATGNLPSAVPAPYKEIFIAAGAKNNVEPALVAAIFYAGEHGSSWPKPPPPYGNGSAWASSTAGAQGPFQFIPATWAAYGQDGDGDGDKDIQDLTDAAFGAANYLGANKAIVGAKNDKIKDAIFLYNHAQWYVDNVFSAYEKFLSGSTGSASDCLTSGSTNNPVPGIGETIRADAKPVFSWVPAGGFDNFFPNGQCTYWSAYNWGRPGSKGSGVTWNGNARDWAVNASAQGIKTSSAPSVGSIVVYAPGRGGNAVYGHVAVVTNVTKDSYTISEMNWLGEGIMSYRSFAWPDSNRPTFIPNPYIGEE